MKKFLSLVLVIVGCNGCPAPEAPLQPVQPTDTQSCKAGCERLKSLGCPEASGSNPKDPESCRKDCEYVQTNGLQISPSCWVKMQSCGELETKCKL